MYIRRDIFMKVDILNETSLDIKDLNFESVLKKMIKEGLFRKDAECCLKLSNNNEIKELNRKYRGKNEITDVLSFPTKCKEIPFIGDIIIDVSQADKQKEDKTLHEEIIDLFIHGLLHLAGKNHNEMKGYM